MPDPKPPPIQKPSASSQPPPVAPISSMPARVTRRPPSNDNKIALIAVVLVGVVGIGAIIWLANSGDRDEIVQSPKSSPAHDLNQSAPAQTTSLIGASADFQAGTEQPTIQQAITESNVIEPNPPSLPSDVSDSLPKANSDPPPMVPPTSNEAVPPKVEVVVPDPMPPPASQTDKREEIQKPVVVFQEVTIARKPSFLVQGITIAQDIQYRVVSKMQLNPPHDDGTRMVEQLIQDTRLEKADPLSRATFETSLRELIGQQFSFKLNRDHEVIEFHGHKDTTKAIEAKPPEKQGFMITSVMDEDGWKELAQLTFFKPSEKAENGRWRRQMTHDWGPLGSWFGETAFAADGESKQFSQFKYEHSMEYRPPDKGADDLPFKIVSADFKTQQATGIIQFDQQNVRVASVQEQFYTIGKLETQVLGQPSPVEMEERQVMTIRVLDQKPGQR